MGCRATLLELLLALEASGITSGSAGIASTSGRGTRLLPGLLLEALWLVAITLIA